MKLLAIAALALLLAGCGGKTAEEKCNDTAMAFVMSKDFVERSLVAPSTAEFPNYTNDQVSVKNISECTHVVNGFVDAENAYGGKIRTRYTVELENELGTDNWKALRVDIQN